MFDLCKLEEMSACTLNAPNCMRRNSMMSELVIKCSPNARKHVKMCLMRLGDVCTRDISLCWFSVCFINYEVDEHADFNRFNYYASRTAKK